MAVWELDDHKRYLGLSCSLRSYMVDVGRRMSVCDQTDSVVARVGTSVRRMTPYTTLQHSMSSHCDEVTYENMLHAQGERRRHAPQHQQAQDNITQRHLRQNNHRRREQRTKSFLLPLHVEMLILYTNFFLSFSDYLSSSKSCLRYLGIPFHSQEQPGMHQYKLICNR